MGTLMINYGVSAILNRKILGLSGAVILPLIIISVSHETTIAVTSLSPMQMSMVKSMMPKMGGMMSNLVSRDIFSWLGFYLSIVIFTSIIVVGLSIRIFNDDNKVRSKMIRLLIGSILVISVLALFDIIQVTRMYMDLMMNLETHALLHIISFAGELLILSAFWTPVNVKIPSLTIDTQNQIVQN